MLWWSTVIITGELNATIGSNTAAKASCSELICLIIILPITNLKFFDY